ncbi:MAG: hypothetical protein GY724_21340 [Actinomycetia bacterium]|nr:hypothetical protein [Actinomycetes bacterium]MCP5032390.1 hypothetical protein [Actinomycetes bacterium]
MTAHTAQTPVDSQQTRQTRTFVVLLVGALSALTVAVLAGITMLILDPTPESTTEAALGFTAAVFGLATAALVIGSVIYAQINNLWHLVPSWIRFAILGLVAIGLIRSIITALA